VETYGFLKEEALGKTIHELLQTRFPEPLDNIIEHLTRKGRWEGELTQTTSSGREIVVESRWAQQTDADGNLSGILEISRDITARKLAEETLNTNLARLELVNAELQEFAFVASHDLQEPLRKIQTFCDLALKRCGPELDSAGKGYLDRVFNSACRMRQLLDDLLQFSRVATKPEPFKKVDLVKIVREAADVFEEKIKEEGGSVEIAALPDIDADENQVLRLFQNLIGNSLKFRSDESPRIKVFAKRAGQGFCELIVKDNGIGFQKEYEELVFKPFQRLHARGAYEGTGMGLAICRKIVERHGGSIRVESEAGKGSAFIIRLPLRQAR
jgi:PAS domain S-box-containing protein